MQGINLSVGNSLTLSTMASAAGSDHAVVEGIPLNCYTETTPGVIVAVHPGKAIVRFIDVHGVEISRAKVQIVN